MFGNRTPEDDFLIPAEPYLLVDILGDKLFKNRLDVREIFFEEIGLDVGSFKEGFDATVLYECVIIAGEGVRSIIERIAEVLHEPIEILDVLSIDIEIRPGEHQVYQDIGDLEGGYKRGIDEPYGGEEREEIERKEENKKESIDAVNAGFHDTTEGKKLRYGAEYSERRKKKQLFLIKYAGDPEISEDEIHEYNPRETERERDIEDRMERNGSKESEKQDAGIFEKWRFFGHQKGSGEIERDGYTTEYVDDE